MKIIDSKKFLLVVGGPTASGKTSLSIRLASHFKTEIISADSRQFYKELNIGVARPGEDQMASVPHHFIASHSVAAPLSAGEFGRLAKQKLDELFAKHECVIVVGGSGLYIQALTAGFHKDQPNSNLRKEVLNMYEKRGLSGLQTELKNLDPEHFNQIDNQNPQRLMRAIERIRGKEKTHQEIRKNPLLSPDYQVIEIGINLDRKILYNHIGSRVDKMMEDGLLEEVRELAGKEIQYAINAVGYKELFAYLNGKLSLDEAVEQIKQNTRRYAKRQITWFKNKTNTVWFKPTEFEAILTFLETTMSGDRLPSR